MFVSKRRNRPVELGPYPLETLPRDPEVTLRETSLAATELTNASANSQKPLALSTRMYRDIFESKRSATVFGRRAPVPNDLSRRTRDIKGSAYFQDASQVGICEIPQSAWLPAAKNKEIHTHAVVIMVEHATAIDKGNLAAEWVDGVEGEVSLTRAAQISTVVAGQIASMGYEAEAGWAGCCDVDLEKLAVLAGLALRIDEGISNPFLDRQFSLAVITTSYGLAVDQPLAEAAQKAKGIGYFFGSSGAVSGMERWRRDRRPSHLGPYPVEILRRQDKPTTVIHDDEVPRIPQRALFYIRAGEGDLGPKPLEQRPRWAYKHPVSQGLLSIMWPMMAKQEGVPARKSDPTTCDAEANSQALKALSHFMGSSITGICEIPDYCWYSHKKDGTPINPYHKYAVVMLIDQGSETFDGACGDDWISGSQSMRTYMRGAEIAGTMSEHIRRLGHEARAQTSLDSDVLHVPLMILSGLGEQSRIGETAVNPFLGPRLKTVVLTTNLPLLPDKPIDFGLQEFCSRCVKCARECPSLSIPFGDKVFFNGYETWKPDSERCTRYRMLNKKGSACGRCIKTCPLTKDVTWDGPWLHRIGSWLGLNVMWLKPYLAPLAIWLDDKLGNGNPNDDKKWWLDLEVMGGPCHEPTPENYCETPNGANRRMIDPDRKFDPKRQKIAYYPASVIPPPDHVGPFPADRKLGLKFAEEAESVEQAVKRHRDGGPVPESYSVDW